MAEVGQATTVEPTKLQPRQGHGGGNLTPALTYMRCQICALKFYAETCGKLHRDIRNYTLVIWGGLLNGHDHQARATRLLFASCTKG